MRSIFTLTRYKLINIMLIIDRFRPLFVLNQVIATIPANDSTPTLTLRKHHPVTPASLTAVVVCVVKLVSRGKVTSSSVWNTAHNCLTSQKSATVTFPLSATLQERVLG